MRTACLLALILLAAPSAQGQAPTYQRMRTGVHHPATRPGYHHGSGYGSGVYGGWDGGFFAPTVIAGSYYQRPYPYHFDYYRFRWGAGHMGAPAPDPTVEMMPVADCPCLAP